jgi:PAS domain S-box-containing protein
MMQRAVWIWTPYMIPLLIGVSCSVGSAWYVLRRHSHNKISRTGALMLLAAAAWALGYVFELGSPTLAAKEFWARVQYVGIVLFPFYWLIYAVQYKNQARRITWRNVALIGWIPLCILILALTNDLHGLMWRDARLVAGHLGVFLVQDFDIGFYVFWAYAIVFVCVGFVILFTMFQRSRKLYRRQIGVLLSGAAMMALTLALDLAGLNPVPELDLEPYGMVATSVVVAWGLARLRLGDLLPVAHERVFQEMSDPILVLDALGRVVQANNAALALLGLPSEDLIGKRWTEACPSWALPLREAQTRQEVGLDRDGQHRVYDVSRSALIDEEGPPTGWVIVLRDVSERVQQERELQRRQSYLEGVLSSSPDAVITVDTDSTIIEWNSGAEHLFGYARPEALGQNIDSLIVPHEAFAQAVEISERVLRGERLQPREAVRLRKDGTLATVIVAAAPVIVQDELQGAIGVYTDITEHKQTEKELRRLNQALEARVAERTSELAELNLRLAREVHQRETAQQDLLRRNRALVSLQSAVSATAASLDPAFVLDTVTSEMIDLLDVQDCTILEWLPENNLLCPLARYSLAGDQVLEQAAQNLSDFPSRKHVLAEKRHWQCHSGQPELDPAEQGYMRWAGAQVLLLLPVVFQGRVIGLIELTDAEPGRVFTDQEISMAQLLANQAGIAIENARLYDRSQQEIAERVRAEAQIKSSLEEKVVLLQEIHHRVKNNLQIISSLLRLQSQQIEDPEALEVFLESQNRVRSMAMIHEMLYQSEDLSQIDFGAYVQGLASSLVRSYHSRSTAVSLSVQVEPVPLSVNDAVPCGLIINELVTNAIKYAFPDGKAGQIHVAVQGTDNSHVRLLVSDNGIGFPQDLDWRDSDSLGLQLVTSLVEQLEGTIELHCEQGAAFEICFQPT